ncbi:hypothetical protein GCM10010082_21500 [Kushneria pakistanensis]|uniref:DUF3742 family protein n=1 Tax=Kushneria pakistanensis TaxID=1508770 RepID=A0ABQ3FKU4_9GAMM|nr:hypothetical protein [Kushneria pakistanensis]GHC27961.1 hypothetical protein GCM10010082_21500 [Kushneria pakistanensis]
MADQSYNAAWRMAEQMKARAQAAQSSRQPGALKMLGAWMIFGILLMLGSVLALFFILLGWAMMPLVRHRMKKQANRNGHTWQGQTGPSHQHSTLEGEYEIRNEPRYR